MEIEVSQADGVTVVEPRGDLDSQAADEMTHALAGLIEQGRSRLVVDLAAVPYIDTTGLSALVAAMRRARTVGGDVRVCALQPEVLSIFALTHLSKVVAVHRTRQEAISSW